jgi:hypothetical protein
MNELEWPEDVVLAALDVAQRQKQPGQILSPDDLVPITGLGSDEIMRAVLRLEEAGYLSAKVHRGGSGAVVLVNALGYTAKGSLVMNEHKRQRRMALLQLLAERTDETGLRTVDGYPLGAELGMSPAEAEAHLVHAEKRGWAECTGMGDGGDWTITALGVKELEHVAEQPATANVMNVIASRFYGQAQVGAVNSTQQQTWTTEQLSVAREFVAAFREAIERMDLSADEREEAEAALVGAEAQLAVRKPNAGILREALASLRPVTENLVASGMFVGLIELWKRLESLL